MVDDDPDAPHTLTVTLNCANASAAYDQLAVVTRAFKLDLGMSSDDFPDDATIIPVGTPVPMVTRSKTNPQTLGQGVVTATTTPVA
jgi:hypothetical protein